MSTLRLLLAFFWIGFPLLVTGQTKGSASIQEAALWAQLLAKYVDASGNVNYVGFQQDETTLITYLEVLGNNPPGDRWGKNKQLAYYINLYNAATVGLILKHYPVSSIRDIKNPWGKKWIRVGERKLSLNHIEHKILRKMDDPRIHFAINCASASCPKLLNLPFKEDRLEEQLESVSRAFINDPTRNQISPGQVVLSPIFKWYRKDFVKSGTLLDFIRQYSEKSIPPDASVAYLKYDWSLNEQ